MKAQAVGEVAGEWVEDLQTLMDDLPISICNVDMEGNITYVNKAFEEIFGYSPEEVLGKNALKLGIFPNQDLKRLAERTEARLKEKASRHLEVQLKRKDGKGIWVEMESRVIKKSGMPVGFRLVSRDITERKCAEKALQESEQKYRILAENSMDGIFLAIGYRLVYTNPAFLNIVGSLSMTEVSEINLMELISPEYRQQVQEDIWKALKGELTQRRYEVKATRINGKGILLDLSLSKVLYQGKPHTLGIVKDITERKRAEESLKESEERYRGLFENSTEGVFAVDLAGNYTSVNKAMEELTGYSREELIGRSYRDFVSPQTAEFVFGEYNKLFRTGEPVHNIVYERISKDGKRGWSEGYANVIKKEGKVVGFQGTLRDITERKRAEDALRSERDKLEALMDGLARTEIGIDIVGVDYKVMFQNRSLKERFGDLTGELCYEKYMGRQEPCALCLMVKAIKSNHVESVELTGADGRNYQLFSAPLPNPDGTVDKAIETVVDITERKRLEQSLKESEERYRMLFENSIEGVFTVDLGGHFTSINKAIEELLGYSKEELRGMSYKRIVHPEDVEFVFKQYNKLFRTGKPIRNLVYEMVRKDGERRLIEGYVNLITEGKVVGFQGTLRDITERKKAEQQLERSFINLAETVSRAIGSRDSYTAVHQRRVADLARLVGEKMGLDKNRLQGLYIGGLLHDIGKISAPETILTKSGKLTDEEWNLIRVHTKRGYEILEDTNLPWPVAEMALHHHERMDGSGYPDSISGDKLSLEVRILGVCDVVEAMSSHRPYRPARSKKEVLQELVSGRGTKYDANVVDIVLQSIEGGEIELSTE